MPSTASRKGDVVAITLPSGIDYAIAYQAIIRAGAIATGINPRLGPTEVDAHPRQRCEPTFVDRRSAADIVGRRAIRCAGASTLDDTDPVAIVWTGGTTGLPKGAWFDHACLRGDGRRAPRRSARPAIGGCRRCRSPTSAP